MTIIKLINRKSKISNKLGFGKIIMKNFNNMMILNHLLSRVHIKNTQRAIIKRNISKFILMRNI